MSGTQADISIMASPKGAEDGSVKLTAGVLTREEASQVFTKTALRMQPLTARKSEIKALGFPAYPAPTAAVGDGFWVLMQAPDCLDPSL